MFSITPMTRTPIRLQKFISFRTSNKETSCTFKCTKHMQCAQSSITHTHTYPFNGPLSRTARVSRYQKGKTNLDFTEARDSEWQWHQLGHMQVCTHSRQITTPTPHHSVFYSPDALPATKTTASKH